MDVYAVPDRGKTTRFESFGDPHEAAKNCSYERLVSPNEQMGPAYRCTMAN